MSFDNDTPVRIRAVPFRNVANALEQIAFKLQDSITRNCLVCNHFSEKGEMINANNAKKFPEGIPPETCKKFGGRPPARVIAFGCDGFEDIDEIPF